VLVSGDWQDAARAAAGEAGSASTEGSEDDREERARSARVGVAADKAFLEQNVQLWREQECFVAPELHLSGIALIGAGNSLEERGGEGGGGRGSGEIEGGKVRLAGRMGLNWKSLQPLVMVLV